MNKALIYCRVSTNEQAKNGLSLDVQEKICRQEADKLGLEIIDVVKDEGKSGKNLSRLGIQDILIKCQENSQIEAVIVQDTDRLARNANDHLTIKATLQKYKVKLISVSQPGIDDSPEGNMVDTIIAAVNQLQSDITGRKTKQSLCEKAKEGYWPGLADVGYINALNPDSTHGKFNKKIIIPDPQTAPFIKRAFKLMGKGIYNGYQIIDTLTKEGFLTSRGKTISPSKFYSMLKNPIYIGEIHWGGIVNKKGKHKPIIKKRLFNQVQSVVAEHNHHACRRRKYQFLLRGYAYCAKCGRRYTAEWHKEKELAYYHCTKSGCDKYVEMNDLEKQVEKKFKKIEFSQDFIDLVVKKARHIFEQRKGEIKKEKQTFINQKTALKGKRDVIEEKLLNGVIGDEEFTRIRNKLRERIDLADDNIYKLERTREVKVDELQKILCFARNIYETYKKAPDILKKSYLNFFWDRFEVREQKITKAVPTPVFKALLLHKKVIISGSRGQGHNIIITLLEQYDELTNLIKELKEINELQKSFL